ncbi:MAG TPA: potassium transporter [Clostridiales bacterium]|nr:potassium transporter [Clostridiales bacterium]
MLYSFALIFLFGLLFGTLFNKLKLPSLTGMLLAGIIIGPYAFNLLDISVLSISSQLRQVALIIILTRAGLSLDINDLKKVGRPAILMSFLPACFEIIGIVIIAPIFLNVSIAEAALIGSVVAAVSPAIIVPRMIKIIENGYGKEKSIPQLLLAGASVDDIFVIVLFTSFTSLVSSNSINTGIFLKIPISIVLGILLGLLIGIILCYIFKKVEIRDTVKVIIILSTSFLLVELENNFSNIIPISGLLAVMSMGVLINYKNKKLCLSMSYSYNKLWIAAEIILFVLVGAAVDIKYALNAGVAAIIIILFGLLFRVICVFLCLTKTGLNIKEKVFCMIAYTPKATVQAAIGAIPLSLGLSCGPKVLTIAVLSIIITAPIGAILIDNSYEKLLNTNKKQ